jgi:hypothetical protein
MARALSDTSRPEVWFAIPSASVERCRERLPAWRAMGYKIAVLQNRERGDIPADITVWSSTYPGWAESVNILCRDIVPETADIVVTGGDDMLPDLSRTAERLAREYFERFPDGFGVMQPCGDSFMWSANYCGSPWMGRRFFTRMYNGTGPMWGGYRHNWADYELYWVARCLGALWMRNDVQQRHAHFSRSHQVPPDWWVREVADHDRADCERFIARKYQGFPGSPPIGHDGPLDLTELHAHETGYAEWRWASLHAPASSPAQRVAQALRRCASQGRSAVALYGAGTHTRRAADALAQPAAQIRCIIDDDPGRCGSTLWGYPVLTLDQAIRSGIDAIVLSSDSHEDTLWSNTAPARSSGIPVMRLYAPEPAGLPRSPALASHPEPAPRSSLPEAA